MSRTDLLAAGDPARPATRFHDDGAAPAAPPVAAAIPHAALAQLPALRREAARDLELLGLLSASPGFCLALMVQAALVLAWAGADGAMPLNVRFVWALALFLGIAAMANNHIQGFARRSRPSPLAVAVGELRALCLYAGLVWGLGAFLVLPPVTAPAWAFAFMSAPSLAAALILRCKNSVIAFAAPATLLTAAAVGWRGQPLLAAVLAGVSIAGLSMLHCAIHRRPSRL